jgi:hypothetical protein
VRSTRLLVERMTVGGEDLPVSYADVFVVVREGEERPGPNDWEVNLRTCCSRRLNPGEHDLDFEAADGSHLAGRALLRFSDGCRHLFRGDGHLAGYDEEP